MQRRRAHRNRKNSKHQQSSQIQWWVITRNGLKIALISNSFRWSQRWKRRRSAKGSRGKRRQHSSRRTRWWNQKSGLMRQHSSRRTRWWNQKDERRRNNKAQGIPCEQKSPELLKAVWTRKLPLFTCDFCSCPPLWFVQTPHTTFLLLFHNVHICCFVFFYWK